MILFENSRQPKILYLLANTTTPITAQYIGDYLNISVRAVRYEIQTLKLKCRVFSCEIVAKPRQGYLLIGDRSALVSYLKITLGELYPFANTGTKEKFVREQLILRYLIIQNNTVTIQEVMDEFSFSRQTILDDIIRANETLEPYHMEIEYLPYHGITIHGTETQKRMLLAREVAFLKNDQLIPYIQKELSIHNFKGHDLLRIVTHNFNLHISQVELFNLYTHILVQAFRIFHGHTVSTQEVNITEYHSDTFLSPVHTFVMRFFPNITFDTNEQYYLINLIFASGFSNDTMVETAQVILQQLEHDTHLSYVDKATAHLAYFLVPILIKSKNKISSTPVKVREIKRLKPLSIELSYRMSRIINEMFNLDLFYNDICALAYIVESSVILPRSKHGLVSLSIGWLLSQSVINNLTSRYSQYTFDYVEPFEVRNAVQAQYHFLLTDTHIFDDTIHLPTITIDTILSSNCVQRIDRFIENQRIVNYKMMIENAQPLSLKSVEDVLRYISNIFDTSMQYLQTREETLTYEVNKSCVVICIFSEKPSVLYALDTPLFWKNEAIKHVLVYCVHNNTTLTYDDVINFIEHQTNLDSEL